jgi:hypothetical protein
VRLYRDLSWPLNRSQAPPASVSGSTGPVPTLLSQALSAATNFAVLAAAGQQMAATGFSVFAICTIIYSVSVGGLRAGVLEPTLTSRLADAGPRFLVVVSGVVLGMTLGLWLLLAGAPAAVIAIALVGGPALVTVDWLRYVWFSRGSPHWALVLDLTWLALVVAVILARGLPHELVDVVLIWALPPAAIVGGVILVNPSFGARTADFRIWAEENGRIGRSQLSEYGLATAASQAAFLALGAIYSVTITGALRTLASIFGPVNVLTSGGAVYILAQKSGKMDQSRALAASLLAAGLNGAVAVLFALGLGGLLFPAIWPSAAGIFVPYTLFVLAGAMAFGPILFLKRAREGRRLLRARLVSTASILMGLAVGIWFSHDVAVWLMAVGGFAGACAWWREVLGAVHERGLSADAAPATEEKA